MVGRDGLRLFLIVAVAFAAGGCGRDWEAATYPASGRVTVNGEPPAGALVQLHPVGEKANDVRNSRPWGVVKPDGTYVLSTYEQQGPGAPAGDYVFTMTWPPDVSVPSFEDRLNGKYSKPEQSQWKFTIKPGENTLPPVEITGVNLDAKPRTRSSIPPKASPNEQIQAKSPGKRR